MSVGRNEVKAAMNPVVDNVLSVQSTLIFQIPVEIVLYVHVKTFTPRISVGLNPTVTILKSGFEPRLNK